MDEIKVGKKYKVVCKNCNNTFLIYKQRLNNKNIYFCCNKCYSNYRVGENNGNWKGGLITKNCIVCNTEFKRKVKDIKKYGGKFCSYKCTGKYYGEIKTLNKNKFRKINICLNCNAEYYIKLSHSYKSSYCSKKCANEHYKTRMLGINNPNYKDMGYSGYKNNSPIRRKRLIDANLKKSHTNEQWENLKISYNNTCACCKIKEPKIKLTKDHIVPISKGGTNGIDNIQPLCKKCNSRKHYKTIFYEHQLNLL